MLAKKQKPKIIHFIWWVPHYRASIFRKLSQNKNFDFEVCAGDNTDTGGGIKIASARDVGNIEGVNWRHIKSRLLKAPIVKGLQWQPEAVKIAWKEDIDAVVCLGHTSLSNLLIRVICKLRGIPVIDWTHGVVRPERGFRWFIRKWYYKMNDALLFYGDFARSFFLENGFKEDKLFVIYNSLDHQKQLQVRNSISSEKYLEIRRGFGVASSDDRLIFHSGRLEEKKNIPLLLDALKQMKDRGRSVKLILVGDGDLEQYLRDYAVENDISDQIVFYGPCYDEEKLGEVMSASDLCVVPGAVGLIAMHSFVYGTPILTCQQSIYKHGPEIETVIEGETGGLFKDGDLDGLVDKMEKMLYPVSCKSEMSKACMGIIDNYYSPEYQERVFVQAMNYVLPQEKQIPIPQ